VSAISATAGSCNLFVLVCSVLFVVVQVVHGVSGRGVGDFRVDLDCRKIIHPH
jgi:hypothetical protein